jgi:hypothetical protein
MDYPVWSAWLKELWEIVKKSTTLHRLRHIIGAFTHLPKSNVNYTCQWPKISQIFTKGKRRFATPCSVSIYSSITEWNEANARMPALILLGYHWVVLIALDPLSINTSTSLLAWIPAYVISIGIESGRQYSHPSPVANKRKVKFE